MGFNLFAATVIKKEATHLLRYHDYDIEKYYKMPVSLLLLNESRLAAEVFNYITSDSYQHNSEKSSSLKRRCETYYDSWLLIYLCLINNEKRTNLYRNILSYYQIKTGGFKPVKENDNTELRTTAINGICAFLVGDLNVAFSTANYIIQIFNLNKKQKSFYMIMNSSNELIENFEPSLERFHDYKVKTGRPLQYALSLSIINLCIAYSISNKDKYLSYALKYVDMLVDSDDFINDYSGKHAIAFSILLNYTNDKRFMKYCESIRMYFKEIQSMLLVSDNIKKPFKIDRICEFAIAEVVMSYCAEKTNGKIACIELEKIVDN